MVSPLLEALVLALVEDRAGRGRAAGARRVGGGRAGRAAVAAVATATATARGRAPAGGEDGEGKAGQEAGSSHGSPEYQIHPAAG